MGLIVGSMSWDSGTPSATANAQSVARLGLPVPDSSWETVDFATPALRASSVSETPTRRRSRWMLVAIAARGSSAWSAVMSAALRDDLLRLVGRPVASLWLADLLNRPEPVHHSVHAFVSANGGDVPPHGRDDHARHGAGRHRLRCHERGCWATGVGGAAARGGRARRLLRDALRRPRYCHLTLGGVARGAAGARPARARGAGAA